jgi:Txe/YoeB family toxin of Txe-Axe toxin-antitoxin module
MQHLDTKFLQQLVDQLSEDSLQSIYLDAFPQPHEPRLDATVLNQIRAGLSQQFLERLLTQAAFELPLGQKEAATEAIFDQFLSLSLDNQDYQQEHGCTAFGFGYPLVVLPDPTQPSRLLQAPLFIWSLELEQLAGQWTLKRSLGSAVLTNNTLVAFLQQRGLAVDLPQYDHLLNDGVLDKDELAGLCHYFLQQLQTNSSTQNSAFFRTLLDEPLQQAKSPQALAQLPLQQATFLWAGVFGIYPLHKTALLQDTLLLKENWPQIQPILNQERNPEDPTRSAFMKHSFPCMDTDPCQQQILHALHKGKDILLQTPPSTQRQTTLAAVLYNILSNAGTCLVVSDKSSTLHEFQMAFGATNLGELALLVDNPHAAPNTVVQSIWTRARMQQAPYQVAPSFIRLLQNCAAYVQHLQGFFKKMHQPILGAETWTDVVGKLVQLQQQQPEVILEKKLQAHKFKFTQHEFDEIVRILPEGQRLFKRLGRFQHPLNALNNRFFETANAVQMQSKAEEAIEKVLKVVQSAQRDAFTYLFEYEQLIEQHLGKVYTNKINLAEEIINGIQGGLSKASYHFNKSDGFYRKFMRRVSDKHKAIEEEKVRLLEVFFKLQRYHQQYNYFQYTFLDTTKSASLAFSDLLEHLEAYKLQVYDWYEKRTPAIQQIVRDLSPRKIHPYVSFENQVRDISSNLTAFERNFVSSQVFRVDFRFVTPNIRKRLTQVEQLETNLKQLQASFEDFEAYHAFKFFWLTLNAQQQEVLQALTEVETNNWLDSFSHWYLQALLKQQEDEYVPNESLYQGHKKAFQREHQILQKAMESHTLEYWRGKQTQAVQAFHQAKAPLTLGALYNPQLNQHSLAHLVKTDPNLFLSFYPVVMVSPAVAATILPLHPHLFDVVVVDQVNQLPVKEVFSVLTRGRYQILMGDGQQLPTPEQLQTTLHYQKEQTWTQQGQAVDSFSKTAHPLTSWSAIPSLWDYAQSLHHYQELSLIIDYNTQQQTLLDFSTIAFYQNKLQGIRAKTPAAPPAIEVHPVAGEAKDRVNAAECEALLQHLWEQPWQQQKVGIAVSSAQQRNAILRALQQLTPHQAAILQGLQANGFFVKEWDQLQGLACDCLLVSTTFTAPFWAPPYAPRFVNVLATCAHQQIYIFTSIPASVYNNYATLFMNKKMQDAAWFYAYLAYAKAVSTSNEADRQAVLEHLQQHTAALQPLPSRGSIPQQHFLNLVLAEAKKNFPALTFVEQYQQAGITVPLAVLNGQQQLKAVFYLDLWAAQVEEEGYAWALFYEQYWQEQGIACYYLWSKDWWQNKNNALHTFTHQLQACL